jgi:demethylmenaquinone methyltransferase/2-methoxy-6-polyprenyl-1,4-benzoquinol methylase
LNDRTLEAYYTRRAAEYDEIYRKSERQSDLAVLEKHLKTLLEGHTTLEIACGTGYWMERLVPVCRSIVATDSSPEVLDVARRKEYGNRSVQFVLADAYHLDDVSGEFSAGFAAFWWSHVPKQPLPSFLRGFHQKLLPGALVCFVDNRYVEGSSTAISDKDSSGNTYQQRVLKDGNAFRVLKNFPTREELESSVAP